MAGINTETAVADSDPKAPSGLVLHDGPLRGIRALDFAQAAAGPISLMYLRMLGADVIKVEAPRGDHVRYALPAQQGMGTTFLGNNLGKRSIVLDLKSGEGLAHAKCLIATADIVLENFRSPAIFQRLGLGYEVLRSINPRVIYIQSSGYGRASGFDGMASNEWLTQAVSGFAGTTGLKDGHFEQSRGTAYFDWFTALVNLQAALVALEHRRRTGEGMMIETSQYGGSLCAGFTRFAEMLPGGQAPRPYGSERQNIVPDLVVDTADEPVAVSALSRREWRQLCDMLDAEPSWQDWAMSERVAHRDEINRRIADYCTLRPAVEVLASLERHGVPASRVSTTKLVSELLRSQEELEGGSHPLVVHVPSKRGELQVSPGPWRFSRTPIGPTAPSPELGEHQDEIMREILGG